MAEYIERESAIAWFMPYVHAGESIDADVVISDIKGMKSADVAEVVHGEWLRSDDDWNSLTTIQCSLCSEEWCFETYDDVSLLNYKYCPNCGAKMDGGNDNVSD